MTPREAKEVHAATDTWGRAAEAVSCPPPVRPEGAGLREAGHQAHDPDRARMKENKLLFEQTLATTKELNRFRKSLATA